MTKNVLEANEKCPLFVNGSLVVSKIPTVTVPEYFCMRIHKSPSLYKYVLFVIVFNFFLSSTTTLMFNHDHPITEQYTRIDSYDSFNIPLLSDGNDDRLTIRMQYKF